MGDYAEKMPRDFNWPKGDTWYGDISNILDYKERLKCKDFGWFLNRFKDVTIHAIAIKKNLLHNVFMGWHRPPGDLRIPILKV